MIKKPTKKKWSVSESHLDALWGQAIRKKYNGRCALCGYPEGQAHHIVKRAKRVLRWNIYNGVYLCVKCHQEAHTGAGARRVFDYTGPDCMAALYDMERMNLKDYCSWAGLTVDEFRTKASQTLKEAIK